jgi:hypothetical protein
MHIQIIILYRYVIESFKVCCFFWLEGEVDVAGSQGLGSARATMKRKGKGEVKMSIADLVGMGPARVLTKNPDGSFTLTVTPPYALGYRGASINLTADQANRYQYDYIGKNGLVQKVFPDLTPAQREVIVSGINEDEWEEFDEEQEEAFECERVYGNEHHVNDEKEKHGHFIVDL